MAKWEVQQILSLKKKKNNDITTTLSKSPFQDCGNRLKLNNKLRNASENLLNLG